MTTPHKRRTSALLFVASLSCHCAAMRENTNKQATAEATGCPANEVEILEGNGVAKAFALSTCLYTCTGRGLDGWEANACGVRYVCQRDPANIEKPPRCVPQERLGREAKPDWTDDRERAARREENEDLPEVRERRRLKSLAPDEADEEARREMRLNKCVADGEEVEVCEAKEERRQQRLQNEKKATAPEAKPATPAPLDPARVTACIKSTGMSAADCETALRMQDEAAK